MAFDLKSAVIVVLGVALIFAIMPPSSLSAQSHTASFASGGGGGDASRDLIAVTGSYGSGASVLYLIDTRTRHMTVYRTENGRKVELVGARDCALDFKLESYHDISEAGFQPAELRKSYTERGIMPASRPSADASGANPSRDG